MKNIKVKLIFTPYMQHAYYLPYGLGVLAAFLKDNHIDVTLDDLSIKIEENNRQFWFLSEKRINLDILQREKELIDYLLDSNSNKEFEHLARNIIQTTSCDGYDLIGISVKTFQHFRLAMLLSREIKSTTNSKVVLGGPLINIYGKEIFSRFPIVDYMIIGDGQLPLLQLIEYLEGRIAIEDVPNLIYRQNGGIKSNARKFFPIEEQDIPYFPEDLIAFYRGGRNKRLVLPYQISRGCAYSCSFCDYKLGNPFLEFKSHRKVVTEIKEMKERYQSNAFHFCDDAINCSYEYLDKLCDIILEDRLGIVWVSYARADNLDKKILHKMKKSGCLFLAVSIESGSDRILKDIKKGFTIQQASSVLQNLHKEGIHNSISILVGYPHETEEDIAKTVEFIKTHSEYIDKVRIASLKITRDTPLYNNPEKFGIENLCPMPNVLHTFFAFDEINGLKWEEKVKQQRYSYKKILWANFKYILSKKYRINFVPFWFYFLVKEKLNLFPMDIFYRLLRLFSACFIKKVRIQKFNYHRYKI